MFLSSRSAMNYDRNQGGKSGEVAGVLPEQMGGLSGLMHQNFVLKDHSCLFQFRAILTLTLILKSSFEFSLQ